MKQWSEAYPWAREARSQIIKNADNWPSKYLRDFGLARPDIPPAGGQWSQWYIGPDGISLRYEPSHSPPHFSPGSKHYYASPPHWPDRPALYDEVIYTRRHDALAQYARYAGLAYVLTGEKKYADNTAYILRSYSVSYPSYAVHDRNGNAGRSGGKAFSQTLDESIWLIDIAWAYDLVGDSLSPAERTAIADKLLRPAGAVIQNNRMGLSNWQTWHNAAIAAVGFALNDSRLVDDAYNNPETGFFRQLRDGASADGIWWEGSWGYHFYTLNAMLYLAEMGERAGMNTYSQENLRAMVTAPLRIAMPDLALPRFNDDAGRALKHDLYYEMAYTRYNDPSFAFLLSQGTRPWQALIWGAEFLPAVSPAAPQESTLFPAAGYAILRSGNPGDPLYLAFKFGPHGGGHGHYDKLSYVTYGAHKLLGLDPGTHSYAADSHNDWDKTTLAHNTVVVDEKDQAASTGSLHEYMGLPAFSLATADAGPVYPGRAAITRTLALTNEYWLDLTRAASLDGKPHRFDWIYHNQGTASTPLALAPNTAFPRSDGYRYLSNARSAVTSSDWQTTWDIGSIGEQYGSIYRNTNSTAAFTITGSSPAGLSGRLSYDWGTASNAYAVYSTKELSGLPDELPFSMEARVFGDGSNNRLTFRIIDTSGEKFLKNAGILDWTGWKTITLNVDRTWSHSSGNDDGIIDLPVIQVALQISRTANGRRATDLLADDIALVYASAGRVTVEDFETLLSHVATRVLGSPETTVVIGDGIDQGNRPVPFAMARRQAKETVFTAVYEPYHSLPHITDFRSLPVTAPSGAAVALHIAAPGFFSDTVMISESQRGDRAFNGFSTDSSIAYIREDVPGNMQTLIVSHATYFSRNGLTLLGSEAPVTVQISQTDDTPVITTPDSQAVRLRLYAPRAVKVMLNGKETGVQREGEYVLVDI